MMVRADRPDEALARRHTDTAVGALAEVCGDPDAPAAARVAAAVALLDRAWGRPRQPLEHAGEPSVRYVIRAPSETPTAEEWGLMPAPGGRRGGPGSRSQAGDGAPGEAVIRTGQAARPHSEQ